MAGRSRSSLLHQVFECYQAYKNAELAHIAPSIGPVAPVNYAQSELNHVSPSVGPTPVNHAQALLDWQAAQLAHQAQAAAAVAGHGRRKRQVSVVGSPEWQAFKNAELAHIAPSTGPRGPPHRPFQYLKHQS